MTRAITQTNDLPDERPGWDPTLIELYGSHYGALVRTARRLLASTALAEEAVQDAFIKYQAAPGQPAPGKELAYLRSIVCNTARGRLRHQAVAERWRPDVAPVEDPEERAVQAVVSRQVRDAVARLPTRQREVLVLRHWGALSERETSDRLEISPGAVKTHGARGRAALREALAG